MIEKKKTGGAAFARPYGYNGEDADHPHYNEPSTGMTLRDWFAGQALSGYAGRAGITWTDTLSVAELGAFYNIADAMIKARDK